MLHQLFNIPPSEHFYLACSGGVDSMAVADFYRQGKKNFTLVYFHHGTPQADQFQRAVSGWAGAHHLPWLRGTVTRSKLSTESWEEYWRLERYKFLNALAGRVVTCHHLHDVAETWIFSSLHGDPKLIPLINQNVVRPFLSTPKEEFITWCRQHHVTWCEDISNRNLKYARNRIRHQVLPELLQINPGFLTVLKKKIEKSHG